jgi:hypothetical protein
MASAAHRWPPPRWCLLLAALLLAGCTAADADSPLSPTGSIAVSQTAPATEADGIAPFDLVEAPNPVDAGPHGRVDEATAGLDGRPVVLTTAEDGVMAVVRPSVPADGSDGWAHVPLGNLLRVGSATSITTTPAGTVLVTGYVGTSFVIVQIDASGQVVTTAVDASLDPARVVDASPALSPDGTVLYLGYTDAVGPGTRVLAIDPASGAVVAAAGLAAGVPGAGQVVGLTVSPAGDRVFLTQQSGDGVAMPRATLTSLAANLTVLSQVPLTDRLTASRPLHLASDQARTAYVTVVVGEPSDVQVRLVAVPAAATEATRLAQFGQLDDITGLAVDGNGEWAYVAGLSDRVDPLTPTITPVDLRTGQSRGAVAICARGELAHIAVPPDADGLLVTGRCAATGFRPAVWTLR